MRKNAKNPKKKSEKSEKSEESEKFEKIEKIEKIDFFLRFWQIFRISLIFNDLKIVIGFICLNIHCQIHRWLEFVLACLC